MNVVLWILQVLLALAVLAAGTTKVVTPKSKLRDRMTWVDSFSETGVKLIGVAEALGGLGLILPAATGIAPILTPIAAVGIAIVMIGAVITHLRRTENTQVAPSAILLVMALIIAWGRFGPYHF
jgi:uncharacterized membrane protein